MFAKETGNLMKSKIRPFIINSKLRTAILLTHINSININELGKRNIMFAQPVNFANNGTSTNVP